MNLFLTKEALYRLSYVGTRQMLLASPAAQPNARYIVLRAGAGDETRTRDI